MIHLRNENRMETFFGFYSIYRISTVNYLLQNKKIVVRKKIRTNKIIKAYST